MKKQIWLALSAWMVCVIGLVSCQGESSDIVDDQTLGHCLTVAKDVNTHAQVISRLSFAAQYNYSSNTVDLVVTGIVIPKAGSVDGQAFPKMVFSGLPWSYNKYGWKVVEVKNVAPTITGISETPKFTNLQFLLLDAFDGEVYAPGIMYKFDMEYGESVVEINGCCMTGKTKSKANGAVYCPEDDTAVKENQRPIYWVDFDFGTSKADIYIYNAKFLDKMPSLNMMVFEGVDFNVANGEFALACDALTPTYDGVPFPSFPISKLKGSINFSKGMSLEFHCDFRGTDYTVNFEGKY